MTFESEVLADSPELWWDMRQAVGTVQPDRSGNGHTGTLDNGPTIDPADGITFDASLVQSVIGDDTFGPTSYATWALEAVVEAASISGGPFICGFPGPSATPDFFTLVFDESAGTYALNISWRGTFTHGVTGAHTLSLATRYHIVADYDGAVATIYVNGTSYATVSAAADGVVFADPEPFYVGDDSFGDPLDGLVRHAIFYDHDLGATRVAAHSSAALSDDPSSEEPPSPSEGAMQATGSLRSLDFGTGTPYIIDEDGIAGLGLTIKSADTSFDGRDGSSGSTDWLDVKVFSIPLWTNGTDAEDAMGLLDDILTAFEPCRDGVDIELTLTLPGWGERSWLGRPRGVDIDPREIDDGIIKAFCRFDALDPNPTGS